MQAQIADIFRQFGLVDLLDVTLVAGLLFAILSWLHGSLPHAASRRIIVAVPAVLLVYVLIRFFDLYLLEQVFQILLLVLLIGAVVVFQSDIRRMVDRLAVRHSGGEAEPFKATVDMLTESTAKMADEKTGALIAIRGREPWESLISGGIPLNGTVSEPLLLGIFQPDSPGHDGAVLIEGNRVVRFAAHLPLAPDLPKVSRFGGTRHAAALGLSEECDALVIAVSEELGTISAAENGMLTEDISPGELKERLETFWRRQMSPEDGVPTAWWRRAEARVALVSCVLSVLLWFLIVYSPNTIVSSITAPVRFTNLPEDWIIDGSVPTEVEVMLSAPDQVFRRLESEELSITIDLSEPQDGTNEIAISDDHLSLPSGVALERVEPPVLSVDLQRSRSVRLPVNVLQTGMLPDSLRLAGVETDPDSVTVVVREGDVLPRGSVSTSPIDFSRITEDTSLESRLLPPSGARLRDGTTEAVDIRIDVEPAGDDETD
jgi:uncharacterized protein (TIGR00159 family)